MFANAGTKWFNETACGIAIAASLVAWKSDFSYLQSMFSFACVILYGVVLFQRELLSNWKSILSFVVLGLVMTLVLEIVAMKFVIWGFRTDVVGIYLLGAPIEEYVYWTLCCVLVPIYVVANQSLLQGITPENEKLHIGLIGKIVGSIPFPKKLAVDQKKFGFSQGRKVPVYVIIQLLLAALFYFFFKNASRQNRKVCWMVTVVFACTAFSNEIIGVAKGFWIYNEARMLGPKILNIPIEAYVMYFLPPMLGGLMFIEIQSRLNQNKTKIEQPTAIEQPTDIEQPH